jgi:hypothetical protein
MNSYNDLYVPPGWDEWYVMMDNHWTLSDPTTGKINNNGQQTTLGGNSSDVFADKASDFIRRSSETHRSATPDRERRRGNQSCQIMLGGCRMPPCKTVVRSFATPPHGPPFAIPTTSRRRRACRYLLVAGMKPKLTPAYRHGRWPAPPEFCDVVIYSHFDASDF